MQSYVQDVRQNAVGQGIVCEFPLNGAYQRNLGPANSVSSTYGDRSLGNTLSIPFNLSNLSYFL